MKTVEPFIISRIFDAPRERVWAAWTGTMEQLTAYLGQK